MLAAAGAAAVAASVAALAQQPRADLLQRQHPLMPLQGRQPQGLAEAEAQVEAHT